MKNLVLLSASVHNTVCAWDCRSKSCEPIQLWLSLAERHLEGKTALLEKAFSVCLGEKCDPDESELGTQIIKDLHQTGCNSFSGEVAQQNQTHLKRVLLAYAEWNPSVGYCQGFI
ncbi:TBC1 domain family member 30-like [Parasteatoda tepidariorum]|uniref:TBC1 domain family member 30-like n=1 Tax=Parasteatoda tepidariorum TaxID=114398 RepID=UPI0039BCDF7D